MTVRDAGNTGDVRHRFIKISVPTLGVFSRDLGFFENDLGFVVFHQKLGFFENNWGFFVEKRPNLGFFCEKSQKRFLAKVFFGKNE